MTDPLRPRLSVWEIVRWIAVLPVAAATYALLAITMVAIGTSLHVAREAANTVIAAVSTLVAVSAGAFTAPHRRFRTACVLAFLFAGALIGLVVVAVLMGSDELSVVQIVLGELVVGVITVVLFWPGGRWNP